MAETPLLLAHHQQQLTQGSGILPEVIAERGYRSILPPDGYSELKPHGFTRAQANLPGLLLPLWTTDGTNGLMVYRPDVSRRGKDGKTIKYELPKGASVRLDCPPRCQPMLDDPFIPLWITEGQKKSDALASHGLCAIALLGVWGFKGKNLFGGTTILADFDRIALNGRDVRIIFDSDVMTKPQVRQALDRLTEHLQRNGAQVTAVYLPQADGTKVGVDDYLVSHTIQELEGLIEAPRPQARVAAPIVELLDESPPMLTRPLMLIDRQTYAATWLWTKTTVTEVEADGKIIILTPPQVTSARRLFVVQDDGTIFGAGGDQGMDDLALDMSRLGASHPDEMIWSPSGVKAYRNGRRPDHAETFRWVREVFDYFMDFRGSLAPQHVMCELSACLVLMTWVADAFTVLPYPWTTAPGPGSGKSKWGLCWAKTSYLGYATTMGGTFAALRDLAEAGATILFDDAELLSTPDQVDPDKRELVLAGNRKGVKIPVKEPLPQGGWGLRWMNAYCPRGFTAIRVPSGALESRCIVIPLLKTADPVRANRDPADEAIWPVNRRHLIDRLWALGLSLLSEAAHCWQDVADEQELIGRAFEPWRAVMAVAKLIERQGEQGLEERIRHVMRSYQVEKQRLVSVDRVSLLIQATLRMIPDVCDVPDVLTFLGDTPNVYTFTTSDVADMMKTLAGEYEIKFDPGESLERSIGHLLRKLRFTKADKEKARGWQITGRDLGLLARGYGIVTHDTHRRPPPRENVRTSATSATSSVEERLYEEV